jgi:hypothetical protein
MSRHDVDASRDGGSPYTQSNSGSGAKEDTEHRAI